MDEYQRRISFQQQQIQMQMQNMTPQQRQQYMAYIQYQQQQRYLQYQNYMRQQQLQQQQQQQTIQQPIYNNYIYPSNSQSISNTQLSNDKKTRIKQLTSYSNYNNNKNNNYDYEHEMNVVNNDETYLKKLGLKNSFNHETILNKSEENFFNNLYNTDNELWLKNSKLVWERQQKYKQICEYINEKRTNNENLSEISDMETINKIGLIESDTEESYNSKISETKKKKTRKKLPYSYTDEQRKRKLINLNEYNGDINDNERLMSKHAINSMIELGLCPPKFEMRKYKKFKPYIYH